MHCDEVKNLLYEYIYEELELEKHLEIKKHISNCSECSKEYTDLKRLLIEDMKPIIEGKNNITAPKNLKLSIKKSLDKSYKSYYIKVASVACILLFMVYVVPVAAYYLVENSPLDKYIKIDSGIAHDFKEGKGLLVNKEHSRNGVTFKVDGIIQQQDSTKVLFSVKVAEGKDFNYATPLFGGDTIRVTDQFGHSYRAHGSAGSFQSTKKDGEIVWVLEVDEVKFWAYKLNLGITAMEIGNVEGPEKNYEMTKKKNIYGLWEVDVYLDRSLK